MNTTLFVDKSLVNIQMDNCKCRVNNQIISTPKSISIYSACSLIDSEIGFVAPELFFIYKIPPTNPSYETSNLVSNYPQ